jgi:hypothetical protein
VVLNPDDHVQATRRLIAIEGKGRVVVRHSPGGRVSDLALDVLVAAGHSPDTLFAERTTAAAAWRAVAGWMFADRVEEIVVDRAHLLPPGAIDELVGLAGRTGAWLWLMWSEKRSSTTARRAWSRFGPPSCGPRPTTTWTR